MSRVLQTLDQIARKKQRDVMYITFHKKPESESANAIDSEEFSSFDWQGCASRKEAISFLEEHQIPYQMCFDAQPTGGVLVLAMPYKGQIYIDMPYDQTDELCNKLEGYLENQDGSPKLPDVYLWLYPLEMAMKNAEHDEPGFWDNM